MKLQLENKTALVTGSTAGIGLEIARLLAVEGANVIITGRNQDKLDQALASIEASGGKQVRGILADVGTAEGAASVIEQAGEIEILVNNLGIYESKNFSEISDEDWFKLFEINVMSGVRLARAYFQQMLDRNSGRIIFISSESGLSTPVDMIHYGTTKTAQLAIARGLANLTKGTRVTVNSVLPGPTQSEGIGEFMRSVSKHPDAPAEQIEAEFFAEHRPGSLIQRLIQPQEVAAAVAYLASPLAGAVNGASLRVEGGLVNHIG